MTGKTINQYDANQSQPRSWTKVTCAGVLGRSYWGGLEGTIELPPRHQDRLNILLQAALTRKWITMKEWQRILGELWSTMLGIPGGWGLLSQLQLVLQRANNHCIDMHKEARHQLLDLQLLAQDLANQPTWIAKVLPQCPAYVGCWVSTDNPSRSITNSDLELAGTIAHEAILAAVHDLCHCTIATFSDKTPAVAWGNKASTTTAGPASYLLCSSSLLLLES